MAGYDYSTYRAALATLLVTQVDNNNFTTILPRMIEYAEQRIYRELDLLAASTTSTTTTTANSRNVTISASAIVVESAAVITPAGHTPDQSGASRNPLQRMSLEMMNFIWPSGGTPDSAGIPQWYTLLSNTEMRVAPAPDDEYVVEYVCEIRPSPLSGSNPTTFLTTYLPDLFLAASMVFGAGYQRDFGAQADDPKLAQSWENQYQTLKASAQVEEARKMAASIGWQAFQPQPLATPPRS